VLRAEPSPSKTDTAKGENRVGSATSPSQSNRGRVWLDLGHYYTSLDRFNEAEAAYLKAIENDSVAISLAAKDSLHQLGERRKESASGIWNGFLKEPLLSGLKSWIVTVGPGLILLIFFIFLVFPAKWVGRIRGNNRVSVVALADNSGSSLGTDFPIVLSNTLVAMNYASTGPGVLAAVTPLGNSLNNLPKLAHHDAGRGGNLVEIAELALGSNWGKIIARLANIVNQPEYIVSGRLLLIQNHVNVILKLTKRREMLQTWDLAFSLDDFIAKEKDLAWEVIAKIWEDRGRGSTNR